MTEWTRVDGEGTVRRSVSVRASNGPQGCPNCQVVWTGSVACADVRAGERDPEWTYCPFCGAELPDHQAPKVLDKRAPRGVTYRQENKR
jgi:hypothetical protein